MLRATTKLQEALSAASSGSAAMRARAEAAEASAQERDSLVERLLRENRVLREQLQLALVQVGGGLAGSQATEPGVGAPLQHWL